MKIALCQFHIEWEKKIVNYERAKKFIREASINQCELVLFPEMSFTGFSSNIDVTKEKNEETLKIIAECAKLFQIAIGFGWVKECKDNTKKAENHYTIISKEGEVLSDYVKIHSFQYGGEGKQFESGNTVQIFQLQDIQFAQYICYDLRFPEIFQATSDKAEVMLVPANWPEKRNMHWKCLLQARAIENQAYVLGINCVGTVGDLTYSGDSCVIDPEGKIVATLQNVEGLVYADITKETMKIRDSFPVKKDRKPKLYQELLGTKLCIAKGDKMPTDTAYGLSAGIFHSDC